MLVLSQKRGEERQIRPDLQILYVFAFQWLGIFSLTWRVSAFEIPSDK